ncbi:MAG: tetratricopeptide repeat protein [bacterium]|nr:tetratricopeptide repeat protein [bacterium]MDD5354126.1 tetratricopeptide repeat protein [bacterium]MDD5756016.1 tetratricopeptide repeat protein [bacterium]
MGLAKESNFPFAAKIMNFTMYFCVMAIVLAFYLTSYDSCQIKITIFQIGGAIILATWLFRALQDGRFTKQRLFWDLPVLLYLLWGIIVFIKTPFKSSMSAIDEFIRLVYYTGIYLAVSDYFSQDRKMKVLANFLLVTVSCAIIYGFMQLFGKDPFNWSGAFNTRVFSTFGNPNFYAAFLVLTGPLILSYFFTTQNKTARVLYGLLFTANTVSLFITGSKGGWLGIAGSISIFTMLMVRYVVHSRRLKVYLVTFTLTAILVSAFGVYRYSMQRKDSLHFRLLTWRSTINMIKLNPVTGNGLGTFRLLYPAYRDREIFRIEGKHQTETQHPENEYLEIINDQGLIGIGLYLWLLYTVFSRGLKRIKGYLSQTIVIKKQTKARYQLKPEVYYLTGYMAGLAGLLAHNLFCVNLRFVSSGFYFWLFLGLIGGAYIPIPKENKVLPVQDKKSSSAPWLFSFKILIIVITVGSIIIYSRFLLADVRHNYGIGYAKMRAWDEAMHEFQTSIDLNPFFVMSRYFLGNIYNDRWLPGDDQRALQCYDEVIARAPHYVMVNYQRGIVHMKTKNYQESLREFGEALKLDPVYPSTYYRIGMIFIQLNNLDKALENFEQAARLNPQASDIYVNIGNIYLMKNLIPAAENYYRQALKLDAANLNAHRNLSIVLLRQNRKTEALRELRVLQQAMPNDPEINKVIKNLVP